MSLTGANADTIRDTGATTLYSSSPSSHLARIDSESLPTGIAMPRSRHSDETDFTVSNRRASSPGWPAAAIQFADRRILSMLSMLAAAMFVIASATAMQPDAGAL